MTSDYEEAVEKFNSYLESVKTVLPVFLKEKSGEEFVGLYEIVTDKIDSSSLSVFADVDFDNTSSLGYHDTWSDKSLREFRTEIKYLCFPLLGMRYSLDIKTIKNIGCCCFKDKYSIAHNCQLAISSAWIKDRDPFHETSTYESSTYGSSLKTYFGEIGCHALQLNIEDYEYIFDSDRFIPV